MATTATATPGKTSFVKQFLNDHPDGNTKTVNEAWQAAGFDGTISPTLVNQDEEVELTGSLRGKTRKAAKGKAAANTPRDSNRYTRQNELREGLPQRPSRLQQQSRERGVDGCRDERNDQSPHHPAKCGTQLGLTGNLRGKPRNSRQGEGSRQHAQGQQPSHQARPAS